MTSDFRSKISAKLQTLLNGVSSDSNFCTKMKSPRKNNNSYSDLLSKSYGEIIIDPTIVVKKEIEKIPSELPSQNFLNLAKSRLTELLKKNASENAYINQFPSTGNLFPTKKHPSNSSQCISCSQPNSLLTIKNVNLKLKDSSNSKNLNSPDNVLQDDDFKKALKAKLASALSGGKREKLSISLLREKISIAKNLNSLSKVHEEKSKFLLRPNSSVSNFLICDKTLLTDSQKKKRDATRGISFNSSDEQEVQLVCEKKRDFEVINLDDDDNINNNSFCKKSFENETLLNDHVKIHGDKVHDCTPNSQNSSILQRTELKRSSPSSAVSRSKRYCSQQSKNVRDGKAKSNKPVLTRRIMSKCQRPKKKDV